MVTAGRKRSCWVQSPEGFSLLPLTVARGAIDALTVGVRYDVNSFIPPKRGSAETTASASTQARVRAR
jgi:hypothetical protein